MWWCSAPTSRLTDPPIRAGTAGLPERSLLLSSANSHLAISHRFSFGGKTVRIVANDGVLGTTRTLRFKVIARR